MDGVVAPQNLVQPRRVGNNPIGDQFEFHDVPGPMAETTALRLNGLPGQGYRRRWPTLAP
jgi:hypothetical protein